jgi:class 3 adenylate cyclase
LHRKSAVHSADEAGTLAALKRHRETIFDPAVAAHNGRIVKLIGDGTIVEFGSVVDAGSDSLDLRCVRQFGRQSCNWGAAAVSTMPPMENAERTAIDTVRRYGTHEAAIQQAHAYDVETFSDEERAF